MPLGKSQSPPKLDGVRRIAGITGIGVLFFSLFTFLPQAFTSNGFPSQWTSIGFAVTVSVSVVTAMMALRRSSPKYEHFDGALIIGLFGYVAWVMGQAALRQDGTELLRSFAFASALISSYAVGRYLVQSGNYERFFASLALFFLAAYAAGIVVAVINPRGIWWGYGLFGSHSTRSWFFWLLVPQPLFAVFSFIYGRKFASTKLMARIYTAAIIVTIVLVLMTRTRTYILTLLGLFALIFVSRYSGRIIAVSFAGVAFLAILFNTYPTALSDIGRTTRLSSFFTGIDPVSGSSDITNGRGQLSSILLVFIREHPFTGIGASTVRDHISSLAASSEAGLLLTFASYGIVPGLLLVGYLVAALTKSVVRVSRSRDDRMTYCLAIIVVLFSSVLFFGSATSLSDWFGLVVVSIVFHLPRPSRSSDMTFDTHESGTVAPKLRKA